MNIEERTIHVHKLFNDCHELIHARLAGEDSTNTAAVCVLLSGWLAQLVRSSGRSDEWIGLGMKLAVDATHDSLDRHALP